MIGVPSTEKLIAILQNCRQKRDLAAAKHLYACLCEHDLETHGVLGNYLVPLLVECGSLPDAQQAFNRLSDQNEYAWSSLISGYADHHESDRAYLLFQHMQAAKVQPNSYTFVALLKACVQIKDVERVNQLRVSTARLGLETDPFVGSALVDVYAKCALLVEAQDVFNRMQVRNKVSWTALIAGYAEHGLGEKALSCFQQMQLEGILPDAVTFVCSLKCCCSLRALRKGQVIHAEIIKLGLEGDVFVGSTLVDMYSKCGSLAEAHQMFEQLSAQNVVSWTALIAGYADNGFCEDALNCFEQMELTAISPNANTYVCILKACSNPKALPRGRQIHTKIAIQGLETELLVGNTLVDMFCKCGSLVEAQEVFDRLPVHDTISWTALIAGYTEEGHGEEALAYFERMQMQGVSPSSVTFVCSLKACGSIGLIDKGREIYMKITREGWESDISIANTLVDMFGKCNLLEDAWKVFDNMPIRDVVSWNALIAGYDEHGLGTGALNSYKEMQAQGVPPDVITYVGCLKASAAIGASETGQELHTEVIKKGLERELFVGNTLVDTYAKCGLLVEAHEVFDRLPVRDAVSWASLISGYANQQCHEEVVNCINRMYLETVSVDTTTLVHCLKSCAYMGALEAGREIHAKIKHLGIESDPLLVNILVDMYNKCGSLVEGKKLFDHLPVRDVVAWNTMIKGYGENHQGIMAVKCFEDMQEHGVKPNAITFTCLLDACSHASLVLKGHEYFKQMREEMSNQLTLDHYICLIDLFARAGYVHDAEDFASEAIQCFPLKEIMTTLLSACKVYGQVALGRKCFQRLAQANQDDAAAYLLMADMCVTAGRYTDANNVEEMRKQLGLKKKPAVASLEVSQKLHEFIVGGKLSKGISAVLEMMNLHLKDEGYVPSSDLVLGYLSEEKREESSSQFVNKHCFSSTRHTGNLRSNETLQMCSGC